MAEDIEKKRRKGLTTAFAATILATSLVLFTAGIIGTILLSVNEAVNNVKQKFAIDLFLNMQPGAQTPDSLINIVKSIPSVREVTYVSPEQAREQMIAQNGEEFFSVLENNPIPPSLQVKLKPEFINEESMSDFETEVNELLGDRLSEISRQRNLQAEALKNINTIMIILASVCGLFLFIVLVLVNVTFRLSVYSRRHLIKTMQLVGARRGYIRKPFLLQGLFIGFISALLANALLYAGIQQLSGSFAEILPELSMEKLGILFIFVAALGIGIAVISTWFAVNRYLRAKTVDLL